jgi:hypothetical protein
MDPATVQTFVCMCLLARDSLKLLTFIPDIEVHKKERKQRKKKESNRKEKREKKINFFLLPFLYFSSQIRSRGKVPYRSIDLSLDLPWKVSRLRTNKKGIVQVQIGWRLETGTWGDTQGVPST